MEQAMVQLRALAARHEDPDRSEGGSSRSGSSRSLLRRLFGRHSTRQVGEDEQKRAAGTGGGVASPVQGQRPPRAAVGASARGHGAQLRALQQAAVMHVVAVAQCACGVLQLASRPECPRDTAHSTCMQLLSVLGSDLAAWPEVRRAREQARASARREGAVRPPESTRM